jgi:hypothetical protein
MTNFEKRINGGRPDREAPAEDSMDEMYHRVFGWGNAGFSREPQPDTEKLDDNATDGES